MRIPVRLILKTLWRFPLLLSRSSYFSIFRCKHNMAGCPTHPEFDSIYIGFSRDGYSVSCTLHTESWSGELRSARGRSFTAHCALRCSLVAHSLADLGCVGCALLSAPPSSSTVGQASGRSAPPAVWRRFGPASSRTVHVNGPGAEGRPVSCELLSVSLSLCLSVSLSLCLSVSLSLSLID